tara:strand:+ start:38844 stop:40067 length:1224 start_codon:yes stop_codon:yes gene_type:complete
MIYLSTRMASILLAFGIFFAVSCSLFETTEAPAERSQLQQLNDQINQINQDLEEDPDNQILKIQKATLLSEYASQQSNPSDRYPIYQNLYSLSEAEETTDNSNISEITDLLVKAWSAEQSSGIRLLQLSRNSGSNQHFYEILAHFDNAIVLQPDSLVTYNLMSTTFYENGSINNAIETLENGINRTQEPNPELLERLAYLYLETGNTEESIVIYENLVSKNENDNRLLHGLINAYMISQRHSDAITQLEILADKFPARYYYKEELAAQLYFLFVSKAEELNNDFETTETQDEKIEELLEILTDAHTIYESLSTTIPANEESLFRMGSFYISSVNNLTSIQSSFTLSTEIESMIQQIIQNYSDNSIELFEKLTEMNPDNMEHVYTLHNLYIEAGMNEKADSIERSYNF